MTKKPATEANKTKIDNAPEAIANPIAEIDNAPEVISDIDKAKEDKIVAEIMAMSSQKPKTHNVKSGGEDVYVVVDGKGKEVRVYKKGPGCENPEEAANEYAAKLDK